MALPAIELSLDVPRILLLSLHPLYARKFFNGEKKIELRRTKPRLVGGDCVVFYVTTPVQAICGGGIVSKVLELPPRILWQKASRQAGVDRDEFDEYFAGCSTAYGICFEEIWEFSRVVGLGDIAARWPGFRPPQLYQYLTMSDARRIGLAVQSKRLRVLP